MSESRAMVIVGTGLAGDSAAAELRAAGWQGRIVMIGDESERPYDRPPLSKAVLLSEGAEERAYLRLASWYGEHEIEMILGDACIAIDPQTHEVRLKSGRTMAYGKLLLATGSSARRLPSLESGAFPLYYLRSLADARLLREVLREGSRIAIVGGGVIGLEIAASAIQRGCSVTVIEGLGRVMARSLSPGMSLYLQEVHSGRGVEIRCGARLANVQDQAGHLLFEVGSSISVDAVVAGIGAAPNVELAEHAGLKVDNGIVVDRHTRTSDPDIHAAGDVARFEGHAGYVRAEHWRHAIDQASVAARVMAGGTDAYREEPWLWSDQYDLNIQITGETGCDSEVLRGKQNENAFILFHLRDGYVVGATSVNRARHKRAIAALVAARARINLEQLADDTVDLKALATATKAQSA